MPGVMPNGLFWTMQIPLDSFTTYNGGREARLRLRDLPLVDTYQFGGELAIPAQVDIDVRWRATEDFADYGEGSAADPEAPGAFTGQFAVADCMGWVSGLETGFSFDSKRLTSADFHAQLGTEQNGAFLE